MAAPPPRPTRYVNDTWCLEDGFGSTRLGDQVARMVLEVDTPFTLGVVGKWGSGKTSVLRRAFATLGGQPIAQAVPLGEPRQDLRANDWERWVHTARQAALSWGDELRQRAQATFCVWYSPWQHQNAEHPLLPLLLEIRAQFTVWQKLKGRAREANRRGGLATLALIEKAIDAAAGLHFGRSTRVAEGTSEAVRKAWREAAPAEPELSDGQRFHLLFEDAVDTLLSGGKQADGRLVVFVDDLDRCEESTVVELLESLKLYLSSRRCVFVLASDEGAVFEALKRHWRGRHDDANREYLEKLFQAVLPVPLPRSADVRVFAEAQFKEHELPADAQLGLMVDELLEPNPRKIKNFVNSACALWDLVCQADDARAADPEVRRQFARRFVLFHYLRTHHKDAWRLLERQPWSLRVLRKVLLAGPPLTRDDLGADFDPQDQRLMEAVFFRSFAHVLRDPSSASTSAEEALKRHGHLPIGDAVDLLVQRADRKRSDEHFIGWFRRLVPEQYSLPEAFIRLPEPPPVQP